MLIEKQLGILRAHKQSLVIFRLEDSKFLCTYLHSSYINSCRVCGGIDIQNYIS